MGRNHMSKKLIIILILIAALMIGGASLFGESNQKETKTPEPLAAMVGQPAPEFSLMSYDGNLFNLSQQKGKKVVLFFNEGIMCYPACWNQMASLPELNSDMVVTASIVTDTADEWKQAVAKMPELGKGMILLDTDKQVSRQYDMLTLPSSMHRGSQPGHTYLILDKDGIVRYTFDDAKMGIQNDVLKNKLTKLQ